MLARASALQAKRLREGAAGRVSVAGGGGAAIGRRRGVCLPVVRATPSDGSLQRAFSSALTATAERHGRLWQARWRVINRMPRTALVSNYPEGHTTAVDASG